MRAFTDASQACNKETEKELRTWGFRLWSLWLLRYPAVLVESRLRKRTRTFRDVLYLGCGLPLYPFAKPVDQYLKWKAREEWRTRKLEPTGSEMYLFFSRGTLTGSL